MSAENRHNGEIMIDPPLPWAKIRESPFLPSRSRSAFEADVMFRVVEDEETGVRSAVALVAAMDSFTGNEVKAHLQLALDLYAPEHAFTGYIEVQYEAGLVGEDEAPMTRYYVIDNKIYVVEPVLTWPDEAQILATVFHG
jgi:hypothetical protein